MKNFVHAMLVAGVAWFGIAAQAADEPVNLVYLRP